jgi:hypothetical protein
MHLGEGFARGWGEALVASGLRWRDRSQEERNGSGGPEWWQLYERF